LEKLAYGRFSDSSSDTPAKGVTFADCLKGVPMGSSPTGCPGSLEKLACGRFSDSAFDTPAKGVTFAGCLAGARMRSSQTGCQGLAP
jgi:hypothetical protein